MSFFQYRAALVDYPRLDPIFVLLRKIIKFGFLYTNGLFILGCSYKRSLQEQCMLAHFVIGQAKLAILKSHQEKYREVCLYGSFI